jgi:serine phosphatase RsbU (regulator of sigma subunit)/pSer/pThr/pTyr-binding forkhead associated (FHA) protein
MAVLEVVKGLTPGRKFLVEGQHAVLGRHPDCDVVLDVAAVSRHHAKIIHETGRYFLEDLGSRNGTFINGQMIHGRAALQEGDQVGICDLAFHFHLDQDEPTGSIMPLLVDDSPDDKIRSSTVMSKLDVSSSWRADLLVARPEVKLKAMVEISKNLGRAVVLEDVLVKLLDSLFKIFIQADRGFIVLTSPEDGSLIPKAVKYRREDDSRSVRISRTIINEAIAGKEAILSADAASDARFQMAESITDFKIRSMMCAPLVDSEERALGVIQIDTLDRRTRFGEDDLELLGSIAAQAAGAVEKAQLHEEMVRQRIIERDLELARAEQRRCIPSEPPQIPGYHFFDYYEAAYQVGGDYFDYVPMSDGRMAVVVADVAGKGIAAALLMAQLSVIVQYQLASQPDPALAVREINRAFARHGWEDRFVTFAVAVVDPGSQSLTVVNAGHMPPLLRSRTGQVEPIGADAAGLPLGVVGDYPYQSTTHNLEPGGFLTLFTDGISEAMDSDGQLYGLQRLENAFSAPAPGADQLGRHILDDVRSFVSGYPQSDDMCLTCLSRNPAAEEAD